jgi:two-component system sensor histidine kinase/response regulator
LLEKQAERLSAANAVKNKLFSVVAHDLKTPMYALRNLFQNVQQFDMPAQEVKDMVPDIMNDLNYTTGLMENLLQWAKSQMQANIVQKEPLDIAKLANDVLQLLRLQARTKNITIENRIVSSGCVVADKDMVHLVLRNLVSNAIKFTPANGKIVIGINEMASYAEVFVQDFGIGISTEAMNKIRQNNYYTTKGTTEESGTGLGLMLCKEFIMKNDGHLYIESEPGKGSIFSFTLPVYNQEVLEEKIV